MAYSQIDIGSIPNDGTGDTLTDAMDLVNSNDIHIEGLVSAQTADRVTDLTNCVIRTNENVLQFPIGFNNLQTITDSSVVLDFSGNHNNNFYLTYGTEIYLNDPLGLSVGYYPSGYIITNGLITNWSDNFTSDTEYEATKPLTNLLYNRKSLYYYFVESPTRIIFKNLTQSITSTQSQAYPVLNLDVVEQVSQLRSGSYESRLLISWQPNTLGTTVAYKVVVSDGTDIIYDSEVLNTSVLTNKILNFGVQYEIKVYATDGIYLSTSEIFNITPVGNTQLPDDVAGVAGYQYAGKVYLSWNASYDPQDKTIDKYEVRIETDPVPANAVTYLGEPVTYLGEYVVHTP